MARCFKVLGVLIVLCLIGAGALSAQVQNKKFNGPADQTYYMCTFVSGCRVLGRGVRRLQGRGEAARCQSRVPGHP